jgi:ATP-dependent RNA helicase RhlE
MQVHESVQTYGKYIPLRDLVVYGGVDIKPQTEALRRGVEIVVATPGRLLDHVQQKSVNFNSVEVLVLDEADRMLDMGFIPDIKRILAMLPKERQSLLFSATFSEEIKKLADTMLKAPVLIEVARRNAVTETVTHRMHPVDADNKRQLLAHILKTSSLKQVLVFVGTKFGASRLAHYLEKQGIEATAIHGDKSQQQRTEALDDFKSGKARVLVATDVAARGLDIDDLPHVINFELPHVPEDYVHRIGRTGRAGKEGDATSLVCAEERGKLAEIEKLIKRPIEQVVVPGFEPGAEFSGPAEKRRGRGGRTEKGEGSRERSEKSPAPRREPRSRERDEAGRERREPRRVEPAKAKLPKLDFDPSKPYESRGSSADTAAPEPKRSHHRPKRPVPALLGGLPKPEPETEK